MCLTTVIWFVKPELQVGFFFFVLKQGGRLLLYASFFDCTLIIRMLEVTV